MDKDVCLITTILEVARLDDWKRKCTVLASRYGCESEGLKSGTWWEWHLAGEAVREIEVVSCSRYDTEDVEWNEWWLQKPRSSGDYWSFCWGNWERIEQKANQSLCNLNCMQQELCYLAHSPDHYKCSIHADKMNACVNIGICRGLGKKIESRKIWAKWK